MSEAVNPCRPLAALSNALAPRAPRIVEDLLQIVLERIEQIRDDEFVVDRLGASIESNVSTLIHLMQQPVDLRLVDPPAGAVQWSLRLAQRGVPFSVLLRAYQLCNARFFAVCLQDIVRISGSTAELAEQTGSLNTLVNDYVDHVCTRIARSYDDEREKWLRHQDAVRAERIAELLDERLEDVAGAERALGYRLSGRHVGLIIWAPDSTSDDGDTLLRLQRLVRSCAEGVGCDQVPLIAPQDTSTVWAWLPLPESATDSYAEVLRRAICAEGTDLLASVGQPLASVEGFARTHQQAGIAQAVAVAAGARAATVTPYAAIATVGFLVEDLQQARVWVQETLGPMAVDDEAQARLRESVAAFLDSGGSLTAAARHLGCHKNTIQYRIRRAEEELGRSVREQRLELELALHACLWLGPAVLTPTPPALPGRPAPDGARPRRPATAALSPQHNGRPKVARPAR